MTKSGFIIKQTTLPSLAHVLQVQLWVDVSHADSFSHTSRDKKQINILTRVNHWGRSEINSWLRWEANIKVNRPNTPGNTSVCLSIQHVHSLTWHFSSNPHIVLSSLWHLGKDCRSFTAHINKNLIKNVKHVGNFFLSRLFQWLWGLYCRIVLMFSIDLIDSCVH